MSSSRKTHIPCRRTSTAYVSGYSSIAFSKNSVKSSSKGVFSMMGMLKVSWNPSMPFPGPFGIPLICSMLLISKQASLPNDFSTRSVTRTAHWECVWMQQPAPRSKAARNNGVQAEGLRSRGFRIYCRADGGYFGVGYARTNMFSAFMSSFWTPDGAM